MLAGQAANCGQSAVSPAVANTAAYAMAGVFTGGTANSSNPGDGTTYIGKTGTTDNAVHVWLVGSSTKVSTAVWVGNIKGKQSLRQIAVNGTQAALLRHVIFRPTAQAIDAFYPGGAFPPPDPALLKGNPVFVPDIRGLSMEAAKAAIELAELNFVKGKPIDSDLPVGTAAYSAPGAGDVGATRHGRGGQAEQRRGCIAPRCRRAELQQCEERSERPGLAQRGRPMRRAGHRRSDTSRRGVRDGSRRGRRGQQGRHHHAALLRSTLQPVTRASRAAATTLGGVAAVGAAAFAWGVLVERNRFTVRHEVVPVLEPGARSLTILHISDLHMAPWQTAKQDFVRSLARFEPDFVIDTGDNLGHVDGNSGVERALAPFTGIPGVFVHGSNDYHGPIFKNPLRYFVITEDSRPGRIANLDTAGMERFFDGPARMARTSTTPPAPSRSAAPASSCSAPTTPTATGIGSTCCPEPSRPCARTSAGASARARRCSASASPTPPTAGCSTTS